MKKNLVAGIALAIVLMSAGVSTAAPNRVVASEPGLANRCVSIDAPDGRGALVPAGPLGYELKRGGTSKFFLKPTGLGRYLVYEKAGRLMAAVGERVGVTETPGRAAEWAIRGGDSGFTIQPTAGRGRLTAGGDGDLRIRRTRVVLPSQLFTFVRGGDCDRYPEAEVGARGKTFRGLKRDGSVFGFADSHLHINAAFRAGGRVIHGENFNRFGITKALGNDAADHGEDGSDDITGNLLRDGLPFGKHDTAGWPGFTGWPTAGTNTHQQLYYVWLQRAWKAGLRLIVAQTVEDEPICEIMPVKSHSCDETETIKREIKSLRALQNYVDAQAGGKGRGWFRLVYTPREARAAIARGKLAVVIGMETSNPFGCSELKDAPNCTRQEIDRGIADLRQAGVRGVFLAHWVDNALAGPAPEGGVKGAFINVFNKFQTGDWLEVGECPDPAEGEVLESLGPVEIQVLSTFYPKTQYLRNEPLPEYPDTPVCNTKGLTALGRYAVRKLMDEGMLIELDHLSEKSREAVLEIAEARNYPLVSGHTGTGGPWSADKLRRLYALGGFASATPDDAPGLTDKILSFAKYRSKNRFFGVGLGTDTGGFASLPGPPEGEKPLSYPFRSYDGKVRFDRERTGKRTFDFNEDGVAHYGLFADLLADVERQPRGDRAMASLFRSAEAYLRTWERAYRSR